MAGQLGSLGALAGLSQSINTSESAQRNLGTLNVLSDNLKRDKAESMALQEMEAKEYDEISKQASSLLGRDRDKINQKALQLQGSISEGIANAGSRAKFFQNGGVSMLKRYKSDLLNSPEFTQYTDNKTNMERIFQLQVAGKGHLLSPSDLRNLQEYQNGTSDKITYSGMMNEIDYPAEFFAMGTEIPDQNVLVYKDNYSRIYGNYLIENGENSLTGLKPEQIETELLSFMKRMNYKGVGKDEFAREQAVANQKLAFQNSQRAAVTKAGTEKEQNESWLSSVNNFMNDVVYDKQVTNKELLNGHYLQKVAKDEDADYLGVSNNPWSISSKRTHTKSGTAFNALWEGFGAKHYKPASAVKVPITDVKKIASLTGMGVNEDGSVNYKLSTDLYNADGNKFEADDVDDYLISSGGTETEGKATVVGSFLGFKTNDDRILMNIVDKKGKVRTEDDNENQKAYTNSQPKHSMFIALQTEDKQMFYKEVDINSTLGQTSVSNILAEDDDTTNTVNTRKRNYSTSAAVKQNATQNKKAIIDNFTVASTANGAFGKQSFVDEAMAFKSPNSKASRDKLLKSYYMAYDAFLNDDKSFDAKRANKNGLTNQSLFTNSLNIAGSTLADDIVNYNIGDSTFIKNYTDAYNNDEEMTAEQKQNNLAFAELWSRYYKTIVSNQ